MIRKRKIYDGYENREKEQRISILLEEYNECKLITFINHYFPISFNHFLDYFHSIYYTFS